MFSEYELVVRTRMSRGVGTGLDAGEYNTFTCSWGDDDQPKYVEWYKRTYDHPTSDIHFWRYIWSPSTVSNLDLDESHRSFSVPSGTNKTQHTIRIENLEVGDTGVYRCEVKIGEKIYQTISPNWLTVNVPKSTTTTRPTINPTTAPPPSSANFGASTGLQKFPKRLLMTLYIVVSVAVLVLTLCCGLVALYLLKRRLRQVQQLPNASGGPSSGSSTNPMAAGKPHRIGDEEMDAPPVAYQVDTDHNGPAGSDIPMWSIQEGDAVYSFDPRRNTVNMHYVIN